MDQVKRELISIALEEHEQILPCGGRDSFSKCFTFSSGYLVFWFDTPDMSTHVLWRKIS